MTVDDGYFPGFLVTEEIWGASVKLPEYTLYPEDLLVLDADGTYTKISGLCVVGLVLNKQQMAGLKPVEYQMRGLSIKLKP